MARPASAKCASSSTENSARRPSQASPGGGAEASAGASAAQQSVPARRPRYSVLAGSNHKILLFFCNVPDPGKLAQLGLAGTLGSSDGCGLGGPSATRSRSPLKINQWASPACIGAATAGSKPCGLVNGISVMHGL